MSPKLRVCSVGVDILAEKMNLSIINATRGRAKVNEATSLNMISKNTLMEFPPSDKSL